MSQVPAASGTLFIVATPIGNLADITLRALETLKAVARIACEDTRQSLKLLNAYQIKKPLISLHAHNEAERTPELIAQLKNGESIAMISDAGTPLISDPGRRLVAAAIREGIPVDSIPGPSAVLNALVLCGFPTDRFYFLGFLEAKSAARVRTFERLKDFPDSLVFFESPHRIDKFLGDAYQVLGNRGIAIAREMTKKFEEVYRGPLREKIADYPLRSWKGEFVVVIQGSPSRKKGEKTLNHDDLTG